MKTDQELIQICIATFAKKNQIQASDIEVVSYKNKSINFEPPPEDGQVSAGILTTCIWVEIQSPIGSYSVYYRKSATGGVYWKSI